MRVAKLQPKKRGRKNKQTKREKNERGANRKELYEEGGKGRRD
jgi:hypothetical protein